MKIDIEFNRWGKRRITDNKKRATTRLKKKGEQGDHFFVGDRCYVLTDVVQIPLRMVVNNFYKIEGAKTKAELKRIWNECYPKVPYEQNEEKFVFFHKFQELKQNEEAKI